MGAVTTWLEVSGLPFNATESDIRTTFERYGPISEICFSSGTAEILFVEPCVAEQICETGEVVSVLGKVIKTGV